MIDKEEEERLAKLIKVGKEAAIDLSTRTDIDQEMVQRLEEAIQDGATAKEKFIVSNLKLVVSIARRYTKINNSLDILDNIQEGNLGLEHAVDKFDGDKGYKFSTYATWWIIQSINRAHQQKGETVYIPAKHYDQVKQFRKYNAQLENEGYDGSFDEPLLSLMSIDSKRLNELRQLNELQPVSYNIPLKADAATELLEVIPDTKGYSPFERVEEAADIEMILEDWRKFLSEEELSIISSRIGLIDGEPCSVSEVAKIYGITSYVVREIESRAHMKISRQNVFPDLVKLCNLDEQEVNEFEIYFLGKEYSNKKLTGDRKFNGKSLTSYDEIALKVIDILELTFGKERIERVVKSVFDEASITKANSRVYNTINRRLGLLNYQGKSTTFIDRRNLMDKAHINKLETKILIRLINILNKNQSI